MAPSVVPIEIRFWKYVKKTRGCWEWTSTRDRDGYGKVWFRGGQARAHRVAFFLRHGEMPKGMVCHTCDNPACVKAEHLYDGTASDNQRDSVQRKRNSRSRRNRCPSGHRFTVENTYHWRTSRLCKICRLAANRRRYEKIAANSLQ